MEFVKKLLPLEFLAGEEEVSCVGEKNGVDEVGSNSLSDNMGIMLVFAALLSLMFILLGLCLLFGRKSACVKKIADKIKSKLLYNSILRYAMQSALKNLVASLSVIFY